jgi:hypothetical protein
MDSDAKEIRLKVVYILKFMQDLVKEGQIKDYSIYRSSLDEVFRKLISDDEQRGEGERDEESEALD